MESGSSRLSKKTCVLAASRCCTFAFRRLARRCSPRPAHCALWFLQYGHASEVQVLQSWLCLDRFPLHCSSVGWLRGWGGDPWGCRTLLSVPVLPARAMRRPKKKHKSSAHWSSMPQETRRPKRWQKQSAHWSSMPQETWRPKRWQKQAAHWCCTLHVQCVLFVHDRRS